MIIDFRSPRWGHTIHASTWSQQPPRIERAGWLRKKVEFPRYSVVVHVAGVQVGDVIVYAGHGGDRCATVVEVRSCRDPRDMFTLTLEDVQPVSSLGLIEGSSHRMAEGLVNLCLEVALPPAPRFYQANPFEVKP